MSKTDPKSDDSKKKADTSSQQTAKPDKQPWLEPTADEETTSPDEGSR